MVCVLKITVLTRTAWKRSVSFVAARKHDEGAATPAGPNIKVLNAARAKSSGNEPLLRVLMLEDQHTSAHVAKKSVADDGYTPSARSLFNAVSFRMLERVVLNTAPF